MSESEQNPAADHLLPKRRPGRPSKPTLGPRRYPQTVYLENSTVEAVEEAARRAKLPNKSAAYRRAILEWLRRADKRLARHGGSGATQHPESDFDRDPLAEGGPDD